MIAVFRAHFFVGVVLRGGLVGGIAGDYAGDFAGETSPTTLGNACLCERKHRCDCRGGRRSSGRARAPSRAWALGLAKLADVWKSITHHTELRDDNLHV